MKRHPYLQPLSRQHHLGLVIAAKAKSCMDNPDDIDRHWTALKDYLTTQIPTHFDIEKTKIADAIFAKSDNTTQVLADTMLAEHEYIESLLTINNPTSDDVKKLANALYDHIRFEEREVFVVAQEVLSDTELLAIYEASDESVKRPHQKR